jgi:enoyl-CoA hydratase
MNDTPLLLTTRPQAGVAVLTMNRPQSLNALSIGLREALVRALREIAADSDVRAVVLTGAGRGFCAGLDLKELGERGLVPSNADNDVSAALAAMPQPVIGAINGVAITGGLELALACDILIASTQARFADTHARIGIVPYWGLSQKLSRLVGRSRAMEMSLSGNFVDAATAERWGLVNRVVEPDALLPAALALAADIASADAAMLVTYKRLIDEGHRLPLGEALQLEQQRSREWSRRLDREQLAARREQVQARGRSQQGG